MEFRNKGSTDFIRVSPEFANSYPSGKVTTGRPAGRDWFNDSFRAKAEAWHIL